jgi:hypothetical protein
MFNSISNSLSKPTWNKCLQGKHGINLELIFEELVKAC